MTTKKKRYYRCDHAISGECRDKECYQYRPHQHPQAHFKGFKNKRRPCYQGYGFKNHLCVLVGKAAKKAKKA